jgi:hypothetical protein
MIGGHLDNLLPSGTAGVDQFLRKQNDETLSFVFVFRCSCYSRSTSFFFLPSPGGNSAVARDSRVLHPAWGRKRPSGARLAQGQK